MPIQLRTPISKRISIYSDFFKDLTPNPLTNDVSVKFDEDSVKESIKNLILTDKGERLMQPLIGGSIRSMLFESNTPAVIKMVQEQVRETIEEYEPRAQLIDVVVKSSIDDNRIEITIYFYVINIEQPISFTVFLERTR